MTLEELIALLDAQDDTQKRQAHQESMRKELEKFERNPPPPQGTVDGLFGKVDSPGAPPSDDDVSL